MINLPGPDTTDWGTLYNNAINQLETMINSKTADITALQALGSQLQAALSEIEMDTQHIDHNGTPLSDVVHSLEGSFNNPITPGTKAKITYDAKGFVTGGSDLIADDIPELAISKITGLLTQLNTLDNALQSLSPDLSGVAINATFHTSRNGLYIRCSTEPLSAVYAWFVEVKNSSGVIVEGIHSSSSNIMIDGGSLADGEAYTFKISIRSSNSSWYHNTFQHTYHSAGINVEDIIAGLIADGNAMTLLANTLSSSNILAQKVAEANQSSQ